MINHQYERNLVGIYSIRFTSLDVSGGVSPKEEMLSIGFSLEEYTVDKKRHNAQTYLHQSTEA